MTDLFALERKIVPYEQWDICGAPKEAVRLAHEETDLHVPTGIVYDESLGWVVLQTSGQGPYIIWQENK